MRLPGFGRKPSATPDYEKENPQRPLPTDEEVRSYLANGPRRSQPAESASPTPGLATETAVPKLTGSGESKS
jgi:hypothetical protein